MRKAAFTKEDDALLMKYIATYNPLLKGRLGMKLYERLVQNAERKWSFSSHHSVQSWRERYKNNQPRFDAQILEYQKKHDISANTFDSSSHSTVQSGVRKTIPVSSRSHTNIPGDSTAPVSENGAKKRQREVDPESTNLDSGVVKKMRREKVSIEGSQPCDSPLHIRSPSAELRNEGKAQVEPPPLMGPEEPEEDEAAPVIGPDDYTGREVSAPARLSHPFSPANIAEVKPSLAPRKSPSPCLVGAVHGELSPSRQQHDFASRTPVIEVSEFVLESAGAHLQPSQEPTPPHTSDINSPFSPLQRRLSLTNCTSSRLEIASRHMPSISQKRKRIPLSQRKRTVVPKDEDDIFSTPPPQVARASPPPRTSGREAPHLVEGPFRSAYTNANGQSRPMPPDRSSSGTDEEAETDGEDVEWPPRRGKRKSPIRPEGLGQSPSREPPFQPTSRAWVQRRYRSSNLS
ncbi:hypothetical protein BJV77DRAFT_660782 [Russula vinacea]|nr:hypothetical protein BJV77DRAFT_660782 [Russula vinacea]